MWGASSALFSRKRAPHKEFLGSDPNWGDLGGNSLCLCAFFALDIRPKNFIVAADFSFLDNTRNNV